MSNQDREKCTQGASSDSFQAFIINHRCQEDNIYFSLMVYHVTVGQGFFLIINSVSVNKLSLFLNKIKKKLNKIK